MSRERQSKYFWPASAITPDDMALLYRAREQLPQRIPITQLLAKAVREAGQALTELSKTIREANREQRAQEKEVQAAKAVIAKVQSLKLAA